MEDILEMSASSLKLSQEDSTFNEGMSGAGRSVALHQRVLNPPGELEADGSYIDAEGVKHYSYGAKYRPTEADKRLTANGANAGNYRPMEFTEEEVARNPFVGLSPGELEVLTPYLEGRGRREIAAMFGICEQTVTYRLSSEASKNCLKKLRDIAEEELEDAVSLSVLAIKDGLARTQDINIRLKAADRQLKVTGRLNNDKPSGKVGAEDMIQQMLAAIQVNVNVSTNTNSGERSEQKRVDSEQKKVSGSNTN